MATDLTLPLVAFSYATGVRSDNKIMWTRVQSSTPSNLFVVVKGRVLNVVQDRKLLETVNLSDYIDATLDARREAEQAGINPVTGSLPLQVLVKDAFLAIAFRLNDGQRRRTQLRLQNSPDCTQLVNAIESRGMEVQPLNRTNPRPDTASSQNRPSTSSQYFESTDPVREARPFAPPTIEAGSLSVQHPKQNVSSVVNRGMGLPSSRPNTALHHMRGTNVTSNILERAQTSHSQPSGGRQASPTHMAPPSQWQKSWSTNISSETFHGSSPEKSSLSSYSSASGVRNQELPAQDDFVFERPNISRVGSRPTSSSLSLPPLPEPTVAKPGSIAYHRSAISMRASQPAASSMKENSTTSQSMLNANDTGPRGSNPLHPSQVEKLLQNAATGLASTKRLARLDSTVDAPSVPDDELPTKKGKTTTETSSEHEPRALSVENYAVQSLDDRQTALEDFMMKNLESPAFTTLCEDMENCWRRIAQGL